MIFPLSGDRASLRSAKMLKSLSPRKGRDVRQQFQRDMKVATGIDLSTERVTPPNRNSRSREWP